MVERVEAVQSSLQEPLREMSSALKDADNKHLEIEDTLRRINKEKGITIHDTAMGSFCTSQEMAGFSISLTKLDDELKKYYDMPADSFGFKKV